MKVGRLTTKIKQEFYEQAIELMVKGDEFGLKQIWSEFTNEEKIVLWSWFSPYERRTFRKFVEDD